MSTQNNGQITISTETGAAQNFQQKGSPDSLDVILKLKHESCNSWIS